MEENSEDQRKLKEASYSRELINCHSLIAWIKIDSQMKLLIFFMTKVDGIHSEIDSMKKAYIKKTTALRQCLL